MHSTILYYAITNAGLTFLPVDDLTIEDLKLIRLGARWIGQQHPIPISISRIGYEDVPSAIERRTKIQELGEIYLGASSFQILEGLFLIRSQSYIALVQPVDSDQAVAFGTHLPISTVHHPNVISHRRLSLVVGQALQNDIIA